jgi:FKBP-type peptidyl-prolyl cis-trans isomerase 2
MRVEEGRRVKLGFICRLEDGTLYDFTEKDQLEFVVGQGNTLPTLEMGVLGMKEGEQRTIRVPTAELDEYPFIQEEAPTEAGFSAGSGGYEFGPGEEGDVIIEGTQRLVTPTREPPAGGFVIFDVEVLEVSEADVEIES